VALPSRLAEIAAHRIFEIVPVDIVEWRSTNKLPNPPPIEGAAIRRVSKDDSGWRDIVPGEHHKTVEADFARGDRGYLATVGGRFIGWIWMSRVSHRDPWSGLHIQIAPDEAYAYAAWVDDAHRHLGISGLLLSTLLSDLQAEPAISRVYGWIDSRNREMQVLLRMMFGFTQAQQVRRALLLGRIGWQVPGSDNPKFGPVSRVGRHSTEA
jgi:acetyltransferase (GNAT) family protein